MIRWKVFVQYQPVVWENVEIEKKKMQNCYCPINNALFDGNEYMEIETLSDM